MPNPLSEAFALAAEVRPRIESIVRFDPDPERQWTMNGVPVTESEADSLILAACVRELVSVSFGGVEIKCGSGPNSIDIYTVYTSHGWDPHEHRNESLTLALLSAVAGLGEE